nr:hypothetical protein [Microbacterium bovistercoris]
MIAREDRVDVFSDGSVDIAAPVAELPLRARLGTHPAGAVVVVRGARGWPAAALAAAADGAAAVIVVDPIPVSPADLDGVVSRARDVPILLDRARLRPDAADDARRDEPAPLYTVRCAAPAASLSAVVVDAIGWLRVLSSVPLRLRAATGTRHGSLGLFDAGAAVATLTATVLADGHADGGARVAALALGAVRTEVVVALGRAVRVSRADAAGEVDVPTRWESRRRLAVRRAMDALISGARPTDLADFAHDVGLAKALAAGPPQRKA